MTQQTPENLVSLDLAEPIWERFFTVAPLVLIGTREEGGGFDLAPKHMATPMGWQAFFGFVCTPRHNTYANARRERAFTVSFPRPSQLLTASLAAAPRCDDEEKHSLEAIPTFPAGSVEGVLVRDGYLYLECALDRIVDGFGVNSLIVGKVVAAHVDADCLRGIDRDDQDLIRSNPLLAYVHPGRFASIDEALSFPFPQGMEK